MYFSTSPRRSLPVQPKPPARSAADSTDRNEAPRDAIRLEFQPRPELRQRASQDHWDHPAARRRDAAVPRRRPAAGGAGRFRASGGPQGLGRGAPRLRPAPRRPRDRHRDLRLRGPRARLAGVRDLHLGTEDQLHDMIHGRDRRGPYGRLFGFLPACEPSLKTIAALCAEIDPGAVGENPAIPAGYTYLAQFVDHDLTFDPTPPGRRVDDPANLRTPRLDLDSLYGAGPLDQPYLYDGARLILGGTCALPDLPRLRKRAIIGDPRNDEHLLIAQLHLLFMRFHNAVVERVEPRFEEAQRLVRWHYQWIVLHDFLDRVLGRAPATAIPAERPFSRAPYPPLEFSGAPSPSAPAMARGSYELTPAGRGAGQSFRILPAGVAAPAGTHLGGFRPL